MNKDLRLRTLQRELTTFADIFELWVKGEHPDSCPVDFDSVNDFIEDYITSRKLFAPFFAVKNFDLYKPIIINIMLDDGCMNSAVRTYTFQQNIGRIKC